MAAPLVTSRLGGSFWGLRTACSFLEKRFPPPGVGMGVEVEAGSPSPPGPQASRPCIFTPGGQWSGQGELSHLLAVQSLVSRGLCRGWGPAPRVSCGRGEGCSSPGLFEQVSSRSLSITASRRSPAWLAPYPGVTSMEEAEKFSPWLEKPALVTLPLCAFCPTCVFPARLWRHKG